MVLVRPGVIEFLQLMSEHFEIVIFTAGIQDYADWVVNKIGANKFVDYKLYRQHAIISGNYYIKDLSRLGRDLNRIIIVDNIAESFQLQPCNGILIKSWVGDKNDTALFELAPLLKEIAISRVEDVREALKKFGCQIQRQSEMGVSHYRLSLNNN